MAALTLTTDNLTNMDADPIVKPEAGQVYGRVRAFIDVVTLAAQADSGTTIDLARLPAGAIFLWADIMISGANVSSLTGDLGDGTTADKFGDGIAISTGAVWQRMSDQDGSGQKLSAETTVRLTTAGANIPSGRVIRSAVYFTVD